MMPDDLPLHYLPIMVRAPGVSERDRAFLASLIVCQRRGALVLSPKQKFWFNRIVREFRAQMLKDSHD